MDIYLTAKKKLLSTLKQFFHHLKMKKAFKNWFQIFVKGLILLLLILTANGYEFVWIDGLNTTDIKMSFYGEPGDPNNHPGTRTEPCFATDSSGNLYLFGGKGYSTSGSSGITYFYINVSRFKE